MTPGIIPSPPQLLDTLPGESSPGKQKKLCSGHPSCKAELGCRSISEEVHLGQKEEQPSLACMGQNPTHSTARDPATPGAPNFSSIPSPQSMLGPTQGPTRARQRLSFPSRALEQL